MSLLITRVEQGICVLDGATTPATEANFASAALEVSDVTGAGDTVIGTIALALASQASLVEAAQLATIAAGVAVGRFGAVAVTRDELASRLGTYGRARSPNAPRPGPGPFGERPLPQCLKCRRPVKTIVSPCSSAASITS